MLLLLLLNYGDVRKERVRRDLRPLPVRLWTVLRHVNYCDVSRFPDLKGVHK